MVILNKRIRPYGDSKLSKLKAKLRDPDIPLFTSALHPYDPRVLSNKTWKKRTMDHIEYKATDAPNNVNKRWRPALNRLIVSRIKSWRFYYNVHDCKNDGFAIIF